MHLPKNGKTLLGINRDKEYELYDKIDKIIYIKRNPFDCMISYFHYNTNRDDKDQHISYKGSTLEEHTKLFLPLYINHIKSTMPFADIILDYDILRENPNWFKPAIRLVYGDIDKDIFRKAVEFSTFDNIKKMGIEIGQQYGLASSYRGHFTRDGRTGQYKEVMKPELIDYIKNECEKEGIEI